MNETVKLLRLLADLVYEARDDRRDEQYVFGDLLADKLREAADRESQVSTTAESPDDE